MNWLLRYIKGIFIGSGFILPGISGGALAAVFGIYERIISFLADMKKDFKKNFLFLFPVGLGGLSGIFIFSFVVSFLFEVYETQILWLFAGCIIGTVPTLWTEAGKKGRTKKHISVFVIAFLVSLVILILGKVGIEGDVPQNFFTWIIGGALIGLGIVVPGLSPSNFLLYMGMYEDMTNGIKAFDFGVIIPIGIGFVVIVLLLSKAMDIVYKKAYASVSHAIFGVVIASTFMIIPYDYNYLSTGTIVCVLLCIIGIAIGYSMCYLEKKYKAD